MKRWTSLVNDAVPFRWVVEGNVIRAITPLSCVEIVTRVSTVRAGMRSHVSGNANTRSFPQTVRCTAVYERQWAGDPGFRQTCDFFERIPHTFALTESAGTEEMVNHE